jgi:hypothetical protein
MLKVSELSNSVLVTLDEQTGVAQFIGGTGERFAGIAFTSDGSLYGVSGDGSALASHLFSIDPTTGITDLLGELATGSDGETLAFNPDDGLLYHASGIGNQNQANGEVFDKLDPADCTAGVGTCSAGSSNPGDLCSEDDDCTGGTCEGLGVFECFPTAVTLSGDEYEELTALMYSNGGFFGGDLGNEAFDDPGFFRITAGGAVTFLGPMDHVAKGMALRVEPLPTPTSTPPPTSTPTATATPTPTPEPSALLVILAGAAVLRSLHRRRSRRPDRRVLESPPRA